MTDPLLITDLEQITGQPRHRIDYAVRRFGPQPRSRVFNFRVWEAVYPLRAMFLPGRWRVSLTMHHGSKGSSQRAVSSSSRRGP